MLRLDLTSLLPVTRKAFDEGRLPGRNCSYSGGCAIGVGLSPRQARDLDENHSIPLIAYLIQDGTVAAPMHQVDDFQLLQVAHDKWWEGSITRSDFETTLAELEAKYL